MAPVYRCNLCVCASGPLFMTDRTLLLLGGTGFVGTSVCEKLVERACEQAAPAYRRILVPTRRAARGAAIRSLPGVDIVEADVHNDADLHRLVSQADAAVNLIAQLHGSESAFHRTHVELPRRLAESCLRSGHPRVVHVSALGANAATLPSRYLRSKAQGEQALLTAPGLRWTLLRPSVIFGARDKTTNLFAQMQQLAPFVPLAQSQARLQPVWVEDVATAVLRCLDIEATVGQAYECTGPQAMTLADLVRLCGRLRGVERSVWPLPAVIGRVQAMLFEMLPGEPLISRDNLDSLSLPSVATPGAPGLQALGIQPASLDQVAPMWLQAHQGTGRLDRWRAMARRG